MRERVTGVEPATSTLARLRSSQLSYTRKALRLAVGAVDNERAAGEQLPFAKFSRRASERRGWDSNPRYPFGGTRDFQSRPFDHSGTSPLQFRPRAVLGDRAARVHLRSSDGPRRSG